MEKPSFQAILDFIRALYGSEGPVPLHAPRFLGNEKKYLQECIDSTFVSYRGKFVTDFESHLMRLTGSGNAVALVNGTAALHMTLLAVGVRAGDEVITQATSFAATAAAIRHAGAEPVFVDVERSSLGMCPEKLLGFLQNDCAPKKDGLFDRITGKRVAAVVPMHTFGHPVRIAAIGDICERFGVPVIEDSAESLGSVYRERQTGTFGRAGIFSFNGNKTVTTGGGGMVVTDDRGLAERIRHMSSTAKQEHPWEFFHDAAGYNLRLPNVNAAIGCAQMEYFENTLENKRETARRYAGFFASIGLPFIVEPPECRSNYWLNAVVLADRAERDAFLQYSNDRGVQTRPVWTLLVRLPPYQECRRGNLETSEWLNDRVVNIPSSVRA
jgi:perosamine synthetase